MSGNKTSPKYPSARKVLEKLENWKKGIFQQKCWKNWNFTIFYPHPLFNMALTSAFFVLFLGSIHYTLIHVWKNYIPFKLLSGKIIYISMPVSGKLVSFHRCCLEKKIHEVCTNPEQTNRLTD